MTAAVNILRWTAFAIACWNLGWSYPGVCELARGKVWPPSLYQSQVFWVSGGTASFALARLFGVSSGGGGSELWRAFAFVLLIVGLGSAAIGHHQGSSLKARKFYALFNHLDLALAIIGLARIDPARAEAMADECRQRVAASAVELTNG